MLPSVEQSDSCCTREGLDQEGALYFQRRLTAYTPHQSITVMWHHLPLMLNQVSAGYKKQPHRLQRSKELCARPFLPCPVHGSLLLCINCPVSCSRSIHGSTSKEFSPLWRHRPSADQGEEPWRICYGGRACKAPKVVDAHFVMQLEHAAQALHPPPVPVLLVCLRRTALDPQLADSAARDPRPAIMAALDSCPENGCTDILCLSHKEKLCRAWREATCKTVAMHVAGLARCPR